MRAQEGALEELTLLDPVLEDALDPDDTTEDERAVFFSHLFAKVTNINTFITCGLQHMARWQFNGNTL